MTTGLLSDREYAVDPEKSERKVARSRVRESMLSIVAEPDACRIWLEYWIEVRKRMKEVPRRPTGGFYVVRDDVRATLKIDEGESAMLSHREQALLFIGDTERCSFLFYALRCCWADPRRCPSPNLPRGVVAFVREVRSRNSHSTGQVVYWRCASHLWTGYPSEM